MMRLVFDSFLHHKVQVKIKPYKPSVFTLQGTEFTKQSVSSVQMANLI